MPRRSCPTNTARKFWGGPPPVLGYAEVNNSMKAIYPGIKTPLPGYTSAEYYCPKSTSNPRYLRDCKTDPRLPCKPNGYVNSTYSPALSKYRQMKLERLYGKPPAYETPGYAVPQYSDKDFGFKVKKKKVRSQDDWVVGRTGNKFQSCNRRR